MASSLIFVTISLIMFIVVFGIMFNFAPVILGAVFSVLDDTMISMNIEGTWLTTYNEIQDLSAYLVPFIMSIGIVLLVVKVLMIATNTGSI